MGKAKRTGVDYWPRLIWLWYNTGAIVEIITGKPLNRLKRKDQRNAWRITHASVAACMSGLNEDEDADAGMCMQVLTALEQRKFGLTLYSAKDRDGDTPLHTVVKTGDLRRLNILLDHLPPELLRSTLEMTNIHGQTPLKLAFDQEESEMLARLLEYCIQNRLCSDLTGIGKNLQGSKTLLHRAMDKGTDYSHFLETYLDIAARNRECGKPGLLVCDEDDRTPWFYLMNHKNSQILGNVLCTLKKHNIDINTLVTDKSSRSTMLHLAYRKKRQECIKLLVDAGADPGKKDTRGLRADQRDHCIGGNRKGCRERKLHKQKEIPQRKEPATANIPTTPRSQQCQKVDEETSLNEQVARKQKERPVQQVRRKEPATANIPTTPRSQWCQEAIEETTSQNVIGPKHQFVCVCCLSTTSSKSKPKVPQSQDYSCDSTKQLLPPWIRPFCACAGDYNPP